MFSTGYLTIARLGRSRTPIRVHWTAPVAAFLFTGARYDPVRWLTFLAVILCHELGHAAMVRRAGAHVMSVELNAIGGRCTWTGHVTRFQRSYIAFGGVLAQALLFVAGYFIYLLRPLGGVHSAAVVDVLTEANVWIALLNLLPIEPLDGAEAWAIVPLSAKKLRQGWLRLKLRLLKRKGRRLH